MNKNEQLIKLIEMYASARGTNNQDLSQLAAASLNTFLNEHVVMELPPTQQEPIETEE